MNSKIRDLDVTELLDYHQSLSDDCNSLMGYVYKKRMLDTLKAILKERSILLNGSDINE